MNFDAVRFRVGTTDHTMRFDLNFGSIVNQFHVIAPIIHLFSAS
jgi:hypothetical protein